VARDTKLTDKDMSVLREGDSAFVQARQTRGTPRDYSMNHRVVLEWDMNKEAERDHMFRLKIDDYEVLLDAEEIMRYLRWV
jgi:hypothetical protein